jgi:sucrose-6-phosphate hydrolase SacC (GH32 family)
MTISRELNLNNTNQGVRLVSQPVKEIAAIRGESVDVKSQSITGEVDITKKLSFPVSTSEMILTFDSVDGSKDVGVELSNAQGQKIRIGYEKATNQFYIDRSQSGKNDFSKAFSGKHTAPRKSIAKPVKLHLFVDVASVELFADDGEVVMTKIFFPDSVYNQVKLYSTESSVQLTNGKITRLQSIWGEKTAKAGKE